MTAQGFAKDERLLKRSDFLRLSNPAKRVHTEHFIILNCESAGSSIRIGITVSRKIGNAVKRSRCKRMIREFYRQNKSLFEMADYNIIAKPGVDRLAFSDFVRELTSALQRLGNKRCLQK